MADKARMGTDPLSWIADSREPKKDSKQSKHSKQDKQPVQVRKSKAGRPRTIKREITKSSQEGLPEGWTRATFLVREGVLDKLKAVAYWDRRTIKDVMDEALVAYLKDKKPKPLPKGSK